MQRHHRGAPAKFGTRLGTAPGGVPIYSSDYDSADESEYPTRQSYQSYVDGVFMGYKWQCVEFARRWLYLNKGYIFEDITTQRKVGSTRVTMATCPVRSNSPPSFQISMQPG